MYKINPIGGILKMLCKREKINLSSEERKKANAVVWLQSEFQKKTNTELLLDRLKFARDAAQDPDFKIIWAGKIQQLEGKK